MGASREEIFVIAISSSNDHIEPENYHYLCYLKFALLITEIVSKRVGSLTNYMGNIKH